MSQHADKVVITNYPALVTKYGQAGADQIWNAIKDYCKPGDWYYNLAVTDASKFPVVTDPKDPKQNKTAIDAIYDYRTPDYVIIVGASDVVPFQDLKNPAYGGGDPDKTAWGDIPYACSAPYSRNPSNFRSPTRVVGRIPDLVAGSDTSYLLGLIKTAKDYTSRPASDYQAYLGVSADVWKGSTGMSLTNIFGSSSKLQLSPTEGPKWSKSLLGTRAHFINCHGSPADPHYYGQKGGSYPIAHSASYISGKISSGTVATAECCYGAELYDPSLSSGQMGICNTYLGSGGYGFFGSSTIAYGPANGNSAADLITQYFLKYAIGGASLGRATLQAQQDFVRDSGVLDPVGLKTLAQFYLLGDPSVHPVAKTQTHSKAADAQLMKGLPKGIFSAETGRGRRRQELVAKGRALYQSVAYARRSSKLKPSTEVHEALHQMAKNMKMKNLDLHSHDVCGGVLPKSAFRRPLPKRSFHVLHGEVGEQHESLKPSIVLVAEEQEGKIVSVARYHRR